MSNEMMFGQTQVNDVNVSTQGGKIASRVMDNIASKGRDKTNIFDVIGSAAGATAKIMETNKAVEANEAKQDYIKIIMSEGYRDANATNRSEMLEGVYKANSTGRSKAYNDAFTTYSSGQYMAEYDNRETEIDTSYYEKAGGAYTAWIEDDSEVQHPAWKEGYDEDMRYMTNKEAGKQPQDFVDYYQSLRPRLDKTVIGTGVVKDLYGEMNFNVALARNSDELKKAQETNSEMTEPFKSPFFLNNKSKQGKAALGKLDTAYSSAITAKKKEFKANALTRVEVNKDTNNPDPAKKYFNEPKAEDYAEAYEDKATQKYNDDMHKYNTMEEARQKSFVYDPDIHTDWSSETAETKELYQRDLDYRLQSQIENGDMMDAATTITSNGSVDSKRLDNTRQTIKAGLNSDNAGQVYGQMMRMSSTNGAALNSLFPDIRDIAKIYALGPLNQIRKEDLSETWNYIQSNPGIMPDKSKSKMEIKELSAFIVDVDMPTNMKIEVQSMYNTMQSYGVEHSDIMKGIKEYADSKPYEVNLNKYTDNEKDVMNYALQGFKRQEDSMLYEDPLTGIIKEQDVYGNTVAVIDKQKLYEYSNKMSLIKQYNKEHYISKFLEKGAARFSETVGEIVSTEADSLGNYKDALVNAGSYVNHLFMTKIDVDGNIVPRPAWEAPNPLNEAGEVTRDGKDPWIREADAVEDTVAMVAETYSLEPEQAVQKTEELVKSVQSRYPEMGEAPVQFLRDVLMPGSFGYSSENFKGSDRVQQEYIDNKQQGTKDSLLVQIEDFLKINSDDRKEPNRKEPNRKEVPMKSKKVMSINKLMSSSLHANEGTYSNSSSFHKPAGAPASGSGWTLASGIDFKHTSKEDAVLLGIPKRFIEAADSAGAWGKSIEEVPLPDNSQIKALSQSEFDVIVSKLVEKEEPFLKEIINSNPDLSDKGVAILGQIKHWAGSVDTKSTEKIGRYKQNIEEGSASQEGEVVNLIDNLLMTGDASDASLVEVLTAIKDSYKPWEDKRKYGHSARYRTLERYIQFLK